jgi:hypothetical protein
MAAPARPRGEADCPAAGRRPVDSVEAQVRTLLAARGNATITSTPPNDTIKVANVPFSLGREP